jgi:DNA invertase Pin-like site-specific DNA recombinase
MNNTSNKITADHLARRAYVYIRQSTPDQVKYNLESKRLQYGLADRARTLGWQDVEVIDEDLGISGEGTPRSGFERLLRAVCEGQVGAVFSMEASRLARNGREWHTLLEFCGIVGVLLIDAQAIYDPRLTNDRLLLGVKGTTISEMEVATLRERAQSALIADGAARGLGSTSGHWIHQRNRWSYRKRSRRPDGVNDHAEDRESGAEFVRLPVDVLVTASVPARPPWRASATGMPRRSSSFPTRTSTASKSGADHGDRTAHHLPRARLARRWLRRYLWSRQPQHFAQSAFVRGPDSQGDPAG